MLERISASPNQDSSAVVAECVDTVLGTLDENLMAEHYQRLKQVPLQTLLDTTLALTPEPLQPPK